MKVIKKLFINNIEVSPPIKASGTNISIYHSTDYRTVFLKEKGHDIAYQLSLESIGKDHVGRERKGIAISKFQDELTLFEAKNNTQQINGFPAYQVAQFMNPYETIWLSRGHTNLFIVQPNFNMRAMYRIHIKHINSDPILAVEVI